MNQFTIRLIQNHIDTTADIVAALTQSLGSYTLSVARDITEATQQPELAQVLLVDAAQLPDDIGSTLAILATTYKHAPIILLTSESDPNSPDEEKLLLALQHGVVDYVPRSKMGMLLLGRRVAALYREWEQSSAKTSSMLDVMLKRAIAGDQSELAIQLIGAEHSVKAWNLAAGNFFGVDPDNAVGRLLDKLPLSTNNLSRLKDIVDQVQATKAPFFIPLAPFESQGLENCWVNIHAYPVSDQAPVNSAPVDVCIVMAPAPGINESEQAALERSQDLQLLLEANRQISGKIELHSTLDTAVEQIKLLLFGDNCQIYLLEKDNRTLRPVYAIGPLAEAIKAEVLIIDRHPLGQLVTSGKTVTLKAGEIKTAIPYAHNDFLLSASLTALRGTIGLVIVSRNGQPFTKSEMQFFESLVQQVSSAVNNARLYEESQRNLSELAVLYEASRSISTQWDDQDVLNTLIEHTVEAVNVSRGLIASWDRIQKKSVIKAEFINPSHPNHKPKLDDLTIELSQRATLLTLINQQRPIFLYISNPALDEIERQEMLKVDGLARLLLPLIAKGETIGWVDLCETRWERSFTTDEVRLARTLTSQIAVALQNIRYLQQTQRTLEETTALYRVANALTTPQDPQAIISTVLQEFLQALDLKQGAVVMFDFINKCGVVKAHIYDDDPVRPPDANSMDHPTRYDPNFTPLEGFQIPLQNNPVYGRLMSTHRPVVIENPKAEWLTATPSFMADLQLPPVGGWGDENAFNILIVPIRVRETIIGTLVAENTRHNRIFDQRDISTGQAMADQLGVGLQNVQLYESEYRRREQAETLREVASVVSSSLNLNEVLERILDQLGRVVEYDSAAIHLIEGEKRRVIAGRGFHRIEDHIGLTFPVKDLGEREPGSLAIQSRKPLVFSDVSGSSRSFREDRHSHIRSWMGIPLIARDKVIGLISIDHSEVDAYTEEDIDLASAFANQVAVTLENARLHEIEVREYERELTIAHQIQETLLPQFIPEIPGLDIAGRIVPARQVGGDFFHFFSTQPEELGVAIGDVSGKGIPAALYMAAAITAIDIQTGPDVTPGEVLNKLNAKLYNRLRENKMNVALQVATFIPLPSESGEASGSLMTAASAGMIAPIGATEHGCRYLPVGGLPIGALPGSQYTYQDDMFLLDPFTTIIFTSDGIVEAQNETGELFGFERLEATILEIISERDAQAITDYIIDAAQKFTGEAEQHDDMTVVVVVKK